MRNLILSLMVVGMAAPALAQGLRGKRTGPPDTCAQIRKGDRQACANAAVLQCTRSGAAEQDGCERRLARRYDDCYNGIFRRACSQQQKQFERSCTRAAKLDITDPASIRQWKAAALGYPETVKNLQSFRKNWYLCFGTPKQCSYTPKWPRTCLAARAEYRKTFKAALDAYIGKPAQLERRTVMKAFYKRDYQQALKLWNDWNLRVSTFAEVGPVVGLEKYEKDAIERAAKQVERTKKRIDKAIERKIARTRCPRNRYRKKEVVENISKYVTYLYKGPRGRRGDAVTVKRTAILSRPRRRRSRPASELPDAPAKTPPRMETETVKAAACVTGIRAKQEWCRVDTMTLERSREYVSRRELRKGAKQKPWTPWRTVKADKQTMLCEKMPKDRPNKGDGKSE